MGIRTRDVLADASSSDYSYIHTHLMVVCDDASLMASAEHDPSVAEGTGTISPLMLELVRSNMDDAHQIGIKRTQHKNLYTRRITLMAKGQRNAQHCGPNRHDAVMRQ